MLDIFRKRSAKSLRLTIDIFVEPEDEVGFHAYAPAFKGLHVSGDTLEEAQHNVADALEVYIESLSKHGDPLPIGPHLSVEPVTEPAPTATRSSVVFEWPSMQMCGIS
jgi:predicted RNase H-like HicB family nuclease